MKRRAQFILSAVISAAIVSVLVRYFDLEQTLGWVLRADTESLLAGISLMVLAYLMRGARWRIWERGLSYWDALRLILIGFMGNNLLPARLGEILRAHCAASRLGGDRRRTAALASIAAERILDGLILSVFGLASLALVSVDTRLEWAVGAVSVVFVALGLFLVLGIRRHDRIRAVIASGHRKFPGHVTSYAREKIDQFLDGLLPLGTVPRMVTAVGTTFVIWATEVASYYLIGAAVWEQMTLSAALLLLVVVNFASLIPLTMGGIGAIEAVAPVYLISAGAVPAAALAIVVLQHAAQYLFTTIAGGIMYVAGGFYAIPLTHRGEPGELPDIAPSDTLLRRAAADSQLLAEARSSLSQFAASLHPSRRELIQLSIVIPAFNEQARLPRTILETIRWCTTRQVPFEIIIADDGSRDHTLALARLFEESDVRIRALACPHMGKGATVRMGVLNAKGETILFMDADGATPLDEIPKLVAALESGRDVAIGSRIAQIDNEVVITTSPHRRIIGRIFAFFVNVFAVEGIGDTQCGFKMFRRQAAEAIFSRQKLVGFAFDVEILLIARRLGLSIAEVPVNWVAQPGSKVNVITDSARMLRDIIRIRWLHRDLVWDPTERSAAAPREVAP